MIRGNILKNLNLNTKYNVNIIIFTRSKNNNNKKKHFDSTFKKILAICKHCSCLSQVQDLDQ